MADARDGDAGDATRDARCGRRGEKQLIVFAAVECLFEVCCGMDGQGVGFESSADVGFVAEMREIGGEAVTEVDGGAGEAAAHEPQPLGETRLRVEVRRERFAE